MVGVTGTNGKTTTTHLLQAVLEADGRRTGLIGTLSGVRTTPEAPELQASARAACATRVISAVAMEVSSHALAQHRVDATWFTVAVFTNLSQDHLDYHRTMEAYFQAKARLFEPGRAGDRPSSTPTIRTAGCSSTRRRCPTRGYSMADAVDLDVGPRGSTFRWEGAPVQLRLGGAFNVSNALAAAAAARELGVTAPTRGRRPLVGGVGARALRGRRRGPAVHRRRRLCAHTGGPRAPAARRPPRAVALTGA